MKLVRGGLRFLGWSLLGLVLLIAAGLALLQTDYARARLEPTLSELVSSPAAKIELSGLRYTIPLEIGLDRLRLADADGVWLELEDAHLEVRPRDLLQGRIAVTDLSARSLSLHRLPAAKDTEPTPSSGPFRLEEQLAGLPEISIDRLQIDRITMAEPVMGQRIELKLTGAVASLADGYELGLRSLLERIDGPVGKIELAGRYAPHFSDLELRLAAVDQGGLVASLAQDPRLGSLEVSLSGRGPLDRWPGKLAAAVDGIGRADGDITLALADEPAVDLALSIRPDERLIPEQARAIVGPEILLSLTASQKDDGGLAVTRLDLETAAVHARSPGLSMAADRKVMGELVLEASDLAKLSSLAGQDLAGKLVLALQPGGTAEAPSVHVTLEGSGLRTATLPVDTLQGRLTATGRGAMAKDGVDVTGLDLRIDDLHTRLQGGIGYTVDGKIDGKLSLAIADLAPLGKILGKGLVGKLALDVVPEGQVDDLAVTLKGEAAGLVVDGRQIGRIDLVADARYGTAASAATLSVELGPPELRVTLASSGKLEGRSLQVERLKLTGPKLHLDGHAAIDLGTGRGTAKLEGQAAELGVLEPLIGKGFSGALEIRADVAERDGKQDGKITLDAKRLVAAGVVIEQARLDATAQDMLHDGPVKAVLELANLRSGENLVTKGRIQTSGTVTSPTIDLGLAGSAGPHEFDLTSRAELMAGATKQTLRLDSLKGRFAGEAIELTKPVTIEHDGKVVDVGPLDLKIGAARATAKGRVTGETVKADLGIDSLPLSMLAAFGAPPMQGRAKLQASLSGRPEAPDLVANLDLTGLTPNPDNKKSTLNASIEAKLSGGRDLQTTSRVTGLGNEPVTANVRLPIKLTLSPFALNLPPETPVDGKVGGSIQLARLADLMVLDGQKLDGTAKLDLKVAGTLADTNVQGQVDLRQGLIEDATSGFSLRQLQAGITARNNKITLDRLSGKDRDKGEITGKGELDLETMDYRVDLTAKQFEAVRSELARATLSGTIELRGNDGNATVKSRLEVERAEIRIPDPAPSPPATIAVKEVGGGRRPVAPPEPSAGPPFIVKLDMAIELPGQVFVRGRGLDSEWKGKIRVRGTSLEPDVTGELESKRGTLDFLDTRFAVAESKVKFDGARPPIPALDIVAKTKKSDITAIVRVRGRANKPEIVMESEPTLPRDEILARVLFNKDMARMTPLQALKLANAVAMLQGGGIDTMGKLRQSTGLDTLDVGGDSTTEAAARAGKYLSDDVYLEVQKGLGPETGKARVEIDLGRNLKATTEVTETSQTGVRLEWKYDY